MSLHGGFAMLAQITDWFPVLGAVALCAFVAILLMVLFAPPQRAKRRGLSR